MNLQKMLQMQKELDERIRVDHHLIGQNLIKMKILAFHVELGELANETRCFKYWSVKPASERATILEEFVDGIHFLLSLGLELNITSFREETDTPASEESLISSFNKLFSLCAKLEKTEAKVDFITLFHHYLSLGRLLGFTKEEIEHAYIGKNEVNHQRQNEGY